MLNEDGTRADGALPLLRGVLWITATAAAGAVIAAALGHVTISRNEQDAAGLRPDRAVAADDPAAGCGVGRSGERSIVVAVPEVYELANIVLTLTAYAQAHEHVVERGSDYYTEVMDHFGEFSAHPLVQRLDEELHGTNGWRRYYGFRESSAAYGFAGQRLQKSESRSYWPEDVFARLLPLVQEFADASDFRAFHNARRQYYADQVGQYLESVDIARMWDWLEARFPQRYDAYHVIFSPLIRGSHSTRHFPAEMLTVMFVAGPDVPGAPAHLRPAVLARLLFTEIDHNYVNPVTESLRGPVEEVFGDWRFWNDDPQTAYASAYETFNEYMTWAVFSLYVRDELPDVAVEAIERLEPQMVRRGFPRFPAFNQELLRLADQRGYDCIPDLYPPILDWAGTFTRNSLAL